MLMRFIRTYPEKLCGTKSVSFHCRMAAPFLSLADVTILTLSELRTLCQAWNSLLSTLSRPLGTLTVLADNQL